jgi:hypothetical protein
MSLPVILAIVVGLAILAASVVLLIARLRSGDGVVRMADDPRGDDEIGREAMLRVFGAAPAGDPVEHPVDLPAPVESPAGLVPAIPSEEPPQTVASVPGAEGDAAPTPAEQPGVGAAAMVAGAAASAAAGVARGGSWLARVPSIPFDRLGVLLIASGVVVVGVTVANPQIWTPSAGAAAAGGSPPAIAVISIAPNDTSSPSPSDMPDATPTGSDGVLASPSPSASLGETPTPAPISGGATQAPVPPGQTQIPTPIPTPTPGPTPTAPPTAAPTPTPIVPATITLTGSSTDLASGGSARTLTATVRDGQGHPVAGQAVTFSQAAGSGSVKGLESSTTDGSGVATADVTGYLAGSVTVTARLGSIDDMLTFVVVPGALDHLGLTPASATVGMGIPQVYATTAYDAVGNMIAVVSLSASLTISSEGTCTTTSCTSSKHGSYTVTATYAGATATAHLVVLPH